MDRAEVEEHLQKIEDTACELGLREIVISREELQTLEKIVDRSRQTILGGFDALRAERDELKLRVDARSKAHLEALEEWAKWEGEAKELHAKLIAIEEAVEPIVSLIRVKDPVLLEMQKQGLHDDAFVDVWVRDIRNLLKAIKEE